MGRCLRSVRRWPVRFAGPVAGGLGVVVALTGAAPPPSPAPVTRFGGDLFGVAAASPSAAWAVGDFLTFGPGPASRTLVLHWDGTKWARVASPSPPGLLGSNLVAVAARAPGDAWAVGNVLQRGNDQTLILHWNGTRWTRS